MTASKPRAHRYACLAAISMIIVLLAALIAVVILWQRAISEKSATDTPTTQLPVTTTPTPPTRSPTGSYRYAAVAADAEPCSSIGTQILARYKGSAVDACIAAMLCVGVSSMQSSGIGGGHFMTIYEAPNNQSTTKIMNTIIARERAPLAATRDMYVDGNVSSLVGGKAIGVPGEAKGFYEAWLKFGRVPWKTLFEPSIKIAREGFEVKEHLANAIKSSEKYIRADPVLEALLTKPDGSLKGEGDVIKRPAYAKTLELLAQDPNALYDPNSSLAQDMIADIQDYDGIVSLQDLQSYEVYDKDPIEVHLQNGNFKLYSPRPPSSGPVFQYIFNILDGYNFTADDLSTSDKTILTYHRIVEAFKFAFAKRSELGDENFVTGLTSLLNNLTNLEYGQETRAKIDDKRTYNISYYEPAFDIVQDAGTSHCSIVTADGSAVSITSTINYYFGSKVIGNRTGIVFNNEMDDFSTPGTVNGFGVPASPANYIEPGKMPMSSMIPTIVLDKDNKVRLVSGASGGTRIITSTAYVSLLNLWLGMNISMATDLPRMHHQLAPNLIMIEPDFSEDLIHGLEALGHKVEVRSKANVGSVSDRCNQLQNKDLMIELTEPCIHGVTDRRKPSKPDGY